MSGATLRSAGGLARLLLLAALAAGAPGGAQAKDFEERVPAEPGGELRVHLDGGSVLVESHDRDEVRVDALAAGLGAGGLDFRLEAREDRVELRGQGGGGWLPGVLGGGPHVRVHIRVPSEFSVDVRTQGGEIEVEGVEGRVQLRTSGGRIALGRIEGDVEARTTGGPIDAEDVEGELRVHTSGGPIRLIDVRGPVDARTSGGGIDVLGAHDEVRAHTSGGSIRVRFDDAPGGRLETTGGSIDVELPDTAGVDLDARTSGGSVAVDDALRPRGRIEPSRVDAELAGGGEQLRLQTSGGSIRVDLR